MKFRNYCIIGLMLLASSSALGQVQPVTQVPTERDQEVLCAAVQDAIWPITDERWVRTRLRPGDITCAIIPVEGFCTNPSCTDKAAIVVLPPVPITNPNAERRFGKVGVGYPVKPENINDSLPQVERLTFTGRGQIMTVSVSTADPAYLKKLVATIKRGFRTPK